MAAPGWYPDPGGAPGTFRYWDGTSWSATTSPDPRSPAPRPTAAATNRRTPLLIALAAVVVLLIVGVLAVRALGDGNADTADPGPTSTVSGWDDSSPTAPPTTPPPSATPTAEPQPCPRAYAEAVRHPADGRVHGGGLSFAPPSGWETGQIENLTWASDVAGVWDRAEPRWIALFAVGALARTDGFVEPQAAAGVVLDCVATSSYYQGFTGSTTVSSRAVTFDGRPGWAVRADIRVDIEDVEAEGDVLDIVVVQTGAADRLGMFVGSAPIGDSARIRLLDRTVAGLTVD